MSAPNAFQVLIQRLTASRAVAALLPWTLSRLDRLVAGLTVLMSTTTLPALRPASSPVGPPTTASSALWSITMMKMTSAASATAFGVSAQAMPLSISGCAFAFVRL